MREMPGALHHHFVRGIQFLQIAFQLIAIEGSPQQGSATTCQLTRVVPSRPIRGLELVPLDWMFHSF